MKRTATIFAALVLSLIVGIRSTSLRAEDGAPGSVLEPGQLSKDSRLGPPRHRDSYFPMTVPASREAWESRRKDLREQVLVVNGLWPMPEKMPLAPVIHGKIERDEYTVEKVFFASYPGHYVTGSLFRPKGKTGKLAGVLCPYGHWNNGRFFDAGEVTARTLIKEGGEQTMEGARFPLQAICAQLARMGCVVFHYDMVGYADSKPIPHGAGFTDAEAGLRFQSAMGLQTYNSIRSLDFLLSLPEVDPKRIGVTGGSGGGTQTFILGAIDDRPTAAFPAVMVSTAMQGGCSCENCANLRIDAGNVDFAALFAPRPMAMTGAKDWTIDIETKGYPELKKVYGLYGVDWRVQAKCWPQFGHNYNQVSREFMYNWFNDHLELGQPTPVVEKPFVPVPTKELSVYDTEHPLPKDAVGAPALRKHMTEMSDRQIAALHPKDAGSLKEFQRVVGAGLRAMVVDRLPGEEAMRKDDNKFAEWKQREEGQDDINIKKVLLGRKSEGDQVPGYLLSTAKSDGNVVIWVHPAGKSSLFENGKISDVARKILDGKTSILAPDVFWTGELRGKADFPTSKGFTGFTYGYNRTLLSNRIHDILTAVSYAKHQPNVKTIRLVGFEQAGPWVLTARALCGDAVDRTVVDLAGFRFEQVNDVAHEMFLPGALKYGGMPGFMALCAPGKLHVHGLAKTDLGKLPKDAYQAAGAAENLELLEDKASAEKIVEWLLR